jgi:hypothetical protein
MIVGYAFETSDYEALRAASKLLFGDGTHLTVDQRRDLANVVHEVLRRAVPITDKESHAPLIGS